MVLADAFETMGKCRYIVSMVASKQQLFLQPVTNAHTHLELTDMDYLCPKEPEQLNVWMKKIVTHSKQRTYEETNVAIQRGINLLKKNGTTHVGDVTATWQSVKPLQDSGLYGIVFLEVHGRIKNVALRQLERAKTTILSSQKEDESKITLGLSMHAPYSCHAELLRQGALWCKNNNVPLCIHVGESKEEHKWIKYSKVAAYTERNHLANKFTGLLSILVPAMKPIKYLDSLGVLSAKPYLVHCVNIDNEEIQLIADYDCTVVHCPRSNERLSSGRMKLREFVLANINVLLGTDSLTSSPDIDIQNEAAFAKKIHKGFVDEAVISGMVSKPLNLSKADK